MRILIILLTLFFSTTALSVERLLCEIDKEIPWRMFKLQISDFINSEKFTPEVEEEFELLKYSFQNIFWLEYDTKKKITEQEIQFKDREAYVEIDRAELYIWVRSKKFSKFFDKEFFDLKIGWNCELANNKI